MLGNHYFTVFAHISELFDLVLCVLQGSFSYFRLLFEVFSVAFFVRGKLWNNYCDINLRSYRPALVLGLHFIQNPLGRIQTNPGVVAHSFYRLM